MTLEERLKGTIRDVPNFPKEGIMFKDITTIMLDPVLSNDVIDELVNIYKDQNIEAVAGIESRGFLFGYPLAIKLGVPFILIRKQGKLPYKKISYDYDLEYGSDRIEIHHDAISHGEKILIIDDLLATGGTALAAATLVKKMGGEVMECAFLVDLPDIGGRERLEKAGLPVFALCEFEGD